MINDLFIPKFDKVAYEFPPVHEETLYNQILYHALTGRNPQDRDNQRVQQLHTKSDNQEFSPKLLRRLKPIESVTWDIPPINNDFYCHLMSVHEKIATIALNNEIRLYNLTNGKYITLNSDVAPRALEQLNGNQQLAIGTDNGFVTIWDHARNRALRDMPLVEKINKLLLSKHQTGVLFSGKRDGVISALDLRIRHPLLWEKKSHTCHVCNLAESNNLLASGGNDNFLKLWDVRNLRAPLLVHAHEAAVRALAWCPTNSSIIATGGGTADPSIHILNINSGEMLRSLQTGSQISNLFWRTEGNQIISTHGFSAEHNHINVWFSTKQFELSLLGTLNGHTDRVIQAAVCNGSLITASQDETLRTWPVWQKNEPQRKASTLITDSLR